MPDDGGLLFAQGMDEADHVPGQLEDVILLDRLGPVGSAVTPLVRRHHMEACIGKGGQLVSPRVPAFREAMTEYDQGAFPLFSNVHLDPIGLDGTQGYAVHVCLLEE
jgi:hypothetical protein